MYSVNNHIKCLILSNFFVYLFSSIILKILCANFIENFYPTHVKRKLRPLIIRYADEVNEQLSISDKLLVKFKETKADYVKQVASIYERSSEGYPFEGVFLDDSFQRMYESDQRFGKMFTTFSLLAIFIASLGLISLAAYSLERRNKEIAIRKVVGASGGQLTQLLMREYVVLTSIASIISVPAVYYYAEHWLSGFATCHILGPHQLYNQGLWCWQLPPN